jgi:hypothetical protein
MKQIQSEIRIESSSNYIYSNIYKKNHKIDIIHSHII